MIPLLLYRMSGQTGTDTVVGLCRCLDMQKGEYVCQGPLPGTNSTQYTTSWRKGSGQANLLGVY